MSIFNYGVFKDDYLKSIQNYDEKRSIIRLLEVVEKTVDIESIEWIYHQGLIEFDKKKYQLYIGLSSGNILRVLFGKYDDNHDKIQIELIKNSNIHEVILEQNERYNSEVRIVIKTEKGNLAFDSLLDSNEPWSSIYSDQLISMFKMIIKKVA